MYPFRPFQTRDLPTLVARMRADPFAVVVAVDARNRPVVSHTPALVSDDGTIRFHLARANPLADALAAAPRATLVFTGPHDYISPLSYGTPDKVGTWNYVSVEAEGPVSVMDDGAMLRFLDDLSATFEAGPAPWTRKQVSPVIIDRLLPHTVGYTLAPSRLEGTTKLGQDKTAAEREGAASALDAASGGAHPLAAMMRSLG